METEATNSRWTIRGIVICSFVWLGLALGLGALVGGQNLRRLHGLTTDGMKTQGTVLSTESENHQLVRYTYQVAGAGYEGAGQVGFGNPDFSSLHPGDSVLLYYRRSEPTLSALGEAAPRLHNEIVTVLSVMLLFPSLIVWRLVAKGVLPRS